MSINLTIEAQTPAHLHDQLREILYGLAQPATWTTAAVAESIIEKIETVTVEPAKPRTTTVKKPKEPKVEPAVETKVDPVAETELDTKAEVPTLEDLRAALMSLSKAEGHGSEVVFKLLGEYDAKNASTVPEDKRAAVIAAVAAKLEG